MATLILAGAGPGDPELITLKAIRALEKADVVLYDALANEDLLLYCKPGVVKHFVGKRFGCHELSQDEINLLILEYAVRYNTILRLKGGDPFIFGRAQEEIDAAKSVNMDVEIVPGISSALAVPASQMIPLTCRGINESLGCYRNQPEGGTVRRYQTCRTVHCHRSDFNGDEQTGNDM